MFFLYFYIFADKNEFKGFSEETKRIIEHHIRTFNIVMSDLVSGEIRVNELEMIKKRPKRCQEICKYTAEVWHICYYMNLT